MRSIAMSCLLLASVFSSACREEEEALTRGEAEEAVTSAELSSSAQALTLDVIEVSTKFTIGGAVRNAASELRDLLASQIPCSTVSVDGPSVTVDFGTLEDQCQFNGHTYAGIAKISVMRTDEKELEVYHEWQGLTDGKISLDGWARVTWSGVERTRRVEHEIDWTSTERQGVMQASGDRTQRLVDPALGIRGGIIVDGTRDWSLENGRSFHADLEGIQLRGQDPVPQAGTYAVTNPKGKTLTLTFERISDTKIRVTATGPRGRSIQLEVVSVK